MGVIDFETFQSKRSTFKIYVGGFKTSLDDKANTYYVDTPNGSDSLVLKIVNELLRSKYNQTTFCCHNLGGFDVLFLLKVLID